MTVHKWSITDASAARVNYGLNIKRPALESDCRKVKIRSYKKRKCPFVFCQKIVIRMENHLTQFHKLSGDTKKRLLNEAEYIENESTSEHSIADAAKQPGSISESDTEETPVIAR